MARAVSALWLNQFLPRAEASREVLYPLRVIFGLAMVVDIILGLLAARRRDFTSHRAWMIRSYAIGLVAGTQVFTLGVGGMIFGTADLTTALFIGVAWALNLAVAERAIRGGTSRDRGPPARRWSRRDEPTRRGARARTLRDPVRRALDEHWSTWFGGPSSTATRMTT